MAKQKMKFFDRWALLFNTNRELENDKKTDFQQLIGVVRFLQNAPFVSRMFIRGGKSPFLISLQENRYGRIRRTARFKHL